MIAPRGEFSPAAIEIRKPKKILFLVLSRLIGLYRNLLWQASSKLEAHHIRACLGDIASQVSIASDLPPLPSSSLVGITANSVRIPGPLRICFLSRSCPMKNLDFLLKALRGVTCSINLSIYGPIDDPRYWGLCSTLVEKMPSNVSVHYYGAVFPSEVPSVLASADLFVLPSRGENFGHVILEALSVGTPVLISDKTPWSGKATGGLEDLPLDHLSVWQERIDLWASLSDASLFDRRLSALKAAHAFSTDPNLLLATRRMFYSALQSSGGLL